MCGYTLQEIHVASHLYAFKFSSVMHILVRHLILAFQASHIFYTAQVIVYLHIASQWYALKFSIVIHILVRHMILAFKVSHIFYTAQVKQHTCNITL